VCLAVAATTLLRHVVPPGLPRVEEIVVDGRIIAVTMALTLGTALVFGLVPALRASREDIAVLLQDSGMRSSRSSRSRSLIVTLEIALALLLLVSTGLLAKSLVHLNGQPLGLDTQRLLSFRLVSPAGRFNTPGSHDEFVARLTSRLLKQPGVLAVASTSSIPLTGNIQTALLAGSERRPVDPGLDVRVNSVSAGYFAAVGIPIVSGREFGPGDVAGGVPVAIINQSAARQIFPGENPVGQHFLHGIHDSLPPTIVGVVADIRTDGPLSEPRPELIEPASQSSWGGTDSYVVRTSLPPAALLAAIRETVRTTAPDLAIADLSPMAELAAAYTARQRFYGSVFGIFALIALSLAAIGVYGLIAYTVIHRRREIAIRSALGAGTWDVLRRFVGQATLLTLIGVAAGAVASLGIARVLRTLLYDVSPTDSATILLAALVLGAIAIGASVIPVLQARRMSLVAALRSE
jgi:putative ABC transport system permease protein